MVKSCRRTGALPPLSVPCRRRRGCSAGTFLQSAGGSRHPLLPAELGDTGTHHCLACAAPTCSIVLAAASGFFRALFTGAWQPDGLQPPTPGPPGAGRGAGAGLPRWRLSGVDGGALQLLLHAVYSRRLPLTGDACGEEVAALLAASNYLEVLPVKEACCALLRSHLSLETAAQTLALAAAHDCADLLADAVRWCWAGAGAWAGLCSGGLRCAALRWLCVSSRVVCRRGLFRAWRPACPPVRCPNPHALRRVPRPAPLPCRRALRRATSRR